MKTSPEPQDAPLHTCERVPGHGSSRTRANLDYTQTFQFVEVNQGLAVFEHKVSVAPPPGASAQLKAVLSTMPIGSTNTGILSVKDAVAFNAGKLQGYRPMDLVYASDEELKTLATKGFMAFWQDRKSDSADLMALANSKALSLDNLIRSDVASHAVFSANGSLLPVALHMEYINSLMSNASYDLDKAFAHLSQRGRIHNLKRQDIPYYNRSSVSSSYLDFFWEPTFEESQLLWSKCSEYGGSYPYTNRYRAIFDLDLLGLRAAGAARFSSFYETAESFRDDDGEDSDDDN